MSGTFARHAGTDPFKPGEVPGFLYRDLGIRDATGGAFTARLIRADDSARADDGWHRHDYGFSLTYVLDGWLDVEFEDIGRHRVGKGDVIHSALGPMHREHACGGGLETLSITSPRPLAGNVRRATIQRASEAKYEAGLRDYFLYRDFGIRAATGDAFGAHIVKAVPGNHPHGQWHTHDLTFQFVYVVNGWVEFEYEDIGRVRLEQGSMVYQPPLIRHAEVAHSDDVEILEAVAPGEFVTRTVEKAEGALQPAE